jgi:hypothetical protein
MEAAAINQRRVVHIQVFAEQQNETKGFCMY